jgi:hypothetical protein
MRARLAPDLLNHHASRRRGGSVAACGALAQQAAIPVLGFLSSASPDLYSDRLRTFRQGLKEIGYVEGQNVEIDYRWAEGHNDRLPVLAPNWFIVRWR